MSLREGETWWKVGCFNNKATTTLPHSHQAVLSQSFPSLWNDAEERYPLRIRMRSDGGKAPTNVGPREERERDFRFFLERGVVRRGVGE